ncbi:MAG: CRISPR-associated endonuclease Cas2 [Paracoccaceae bacterium]
MHVIVVYDIPHDRTRAKVADICQDYGLDRMQYSAFQGELVRVHQEELMEKLQSRLGKRPGKIALYPICARDWEGRIEILQERKAKAAKEDADAAGE